MAIFEVGETVKRINKDNGMAGAKVGQIATIMRVRSEHTNFSGEITWLYVSFIKDNYRVRETWNARFAEVVESVPGVN